MSFAGDGPLLQEAKEFVERENLSDRVLFFGNRDDITELLHKSSIFILLSDWEGLPLSILEAMRCGLPILASDVGGVKEAVYNSENGYVISKNDLDELLSKLNNIANKSFLANGNGCEKVVYYLKKISHLKKCITKQIAYYKVDSC